MKRGHLCAWLLFLASAGCASQYAYTLRVDPPVEDGDLKAQIVVDTIANDVTVDLTNKTDQVLQIEWAKIAISDAKGRVSPLRPDVDLGWIPPGATVAAKLFPLALPRKGHEAAAYEGRHFDLTIPAIVRREPKQYHYSLVAHVREL
jgi:hypothetical protein